MSKDFQARAADRDGNRVPIGPALTKRVAAVNLLLNYQVDGDVVAAGGVVVTTVKHDGTRFVTEHLVPLEEG